MGRIMKSLGSIAVAATLSFVAQYASAANKVIVNIPSYTLDVIDDAGAVISSYPIRVGKPNTPTPIGEGVIDEKRRDIRFRYLDGPKEGQLITKSYLTPEKKSIKMPYDKMKGMHFTFARWVDGVIHATTDYWTLGLPKSHACIGMTIDDMLKFYDEVGEAPIQMRIGYDTVKVDGDCITFYADVYNKHPDILGVLVAAGINITDFASAENRLKLIDQELHYETMKVMRAVNGGKSLDGLKDTLRYEISVEDFLLPCNPTSMIMSSVVEKGKGFVDTVVAAGFSKGVAVELSSKIEGLDYSKLGIGDIFTFYVNDGLDSSGVKNISKFEYIGSQGTKAFDISDVFVE